MANINPAVLAATAAISVLGGSLLAGASLAQAPPSAPPSAPATPTPPLWIKQPTPDQMRQASKGVTAPQGARAVLRCHVDAAGLFSDCRTLAETPSGSGYAQSLAAMTPFLQMNPERIATEAPDGTYALAMDSLRFDTPPTWLHKPTAQDLMTVWPREAWAKGQGGRAVINCLVNVQGALYDCVPTRETPAGQSFGAAAIALTPQFLMKPALRGGQPVISVVNIPLTFIWPKGASPPGRSDTDHFVVPANITWLEAPSYADVATAYPKRARETHASGHATVDCAFTSQQRLTSCRVLSEEPKGLGFGGAAEALARHFQAPPTLAGKSLRQASVQLPFAFDPAVLDAAKPPTIGTPQWTTLPTAEHTSAAFAAVFKAGVSGTVRVMLNCTVQPGGGVGACKVVREEPTGQGVSDAALGLIPDFKVTTWTNEGLPTVGGTLNVPLRYEGAAAAPATKPAAAGG
jgi:hypothetical protein